MTTEQVIAPMMTPFPINRAGQFEPARAMDAMQAVIAESRQITREEAAAHTGLRPQHQMYWRINPHPKNPNRRPRAGWIIVGPSSRSENAELEMNKFARNKDAEPLYAYGSYEGGGGSVLSQNENESQGFPFGRFTELFAKGGIVEMPLSQLVHLGYHKRPACVAARPELANVLQLSCPLQCTDEHGDIFTFPSQQILNQHIDTSPRHKNERGSMAAANILKDQLQQSNVSPETIASIVAAVMTAMGGKTAPVEPEPVAPAPPVIGNPWELPDRKDLWAAMKNAGVAEGHKFVELNTEAMQQILREHFSRLETEAGYEEVA